MLRKRKRFKVNRKANAKPGGIIKLNAPKEKQPRNRAEWLNFNWLQIGVQLKNAI